MNKNLLSIIIAAVLIVLVGLIIAGYNYNNGSLAKIFSYFSKSKIDASGIILFYGEGCPHCKIVDDFISVNKVEEKVKFTRLEVFNNKDNAKILLERAQSCGLDTQQIGVPFLWTGQTCVIGDQDVIKFFQEKIK